MPNQPSSRAARLAWIVSLILTLSFCAHATSIRQLQLSEVVDASRVIFAGEVIASESQWNSTRSRITTVVRFRVDQVIKGDVSNQELELRFAGGKVDDVEQRVEAMIYPQVGERGVYFVADPDHTFVHPLAGWAQGHYKERIVDGQSRMVTATDLPIATIDRTKATQKTSSGVALSIGHARGIETGEVISEALPKDEFIRLIQQQSDLPK